MGHEQKHVRMEQTNQLGSSGKRTRRFTFEIEKPEYRERLAWEHEWNFKLLRYLNETLLCAVLITPNVSNGTAVCGPDEQKLSCIVT